MKQPNPIPATQDELHALFWYDPIDGRFGRRGRALPKPDSEGRFSVMVNKQAFPAPRVIWKWMTGEEAGPVVDHEDRNPFNNQWKNLRSVSVTQNNHNRELPFGEATNVKEHSGGYMVVVRSTHHGSYTRWHRGMDEAMRDAEKARNLFSGGLAPGADEPEGGWPAAPPEGAFLPQSWREFLSGRTKAGLDAARRKGTRLGRKPGIVEDPQVFLAKYPQVVRCVQGGMTIRATEKMTHVSKNTVLKVSRFLREAAPPPETDWGDLHDEI